ncbi:MAG: type III polyketide synthase [Alphaproteobacteria bacterium]
MAWASQQFDGAFGDLDRLLGVFENAAIGTRYSCVPIEWYSRDHGLGERNRLYLDNAVALLESAAVTALARGGLTASDIDVIVSVSTTGIATPSLDALLMERLPFRRDVQRLPVFGLGCAGGVLGLARAAALARATPGAKVLFLVVELCALTFRAADRTKSNLIAVALFGDGAAAGVLGRDLDGPAVTAWGEHTWSHSLDVMGWNIADDGFGVLFSRDIPHLVRRRMRAAAESFLSRHDLALDDIDSFVCHPGGAKVVDALEEAYGLPCGGLVHSRAVLREYGNMSAATVMFVLDRVLGAGRRRHLVSSLGPGFTAAFLVLEEA